MPFLCKAKMNNYQGGAFGQKYAHRNAKLGAEKDSKDKNTHYNACMVLKIN